MNRFHLKGDFQEGRSYSRAVVLEGPSKLVFLAGAARPFDEQHRSLGGDFAAQARGSFEDLERTLAELGGTLADVVTMTVFVTDMRHGDEFVKIRAEVFGEDFPASTLVGVDSLAVPGMLVEVQATAALS